MGRIHKLLEKINEIETKTVWGVEPVDYKLVGADEDAEFIPKEADDAGDTTWYWTSRKMVELLGYKWFVGAQGVAAAFAFSRDELYLKIRDAFQIGVFDRLRICPLCKKFFVADDARKQFCTDEHRNEFNNKRRLESGWFKKNRRDKRKVQLAKARRLQREGKSATQIAKETKLPLRVLKRGADNTLKTMGDCHRLYGPPRRVNLKLWLYTSPDPAPGAELFPRRGNRGAQCRW